MADEMKRVSFLILRTPSYRTLGPIIAEALSQGDWDVEVVLGPPVATRHMKSYQNARPDNVPLLLRGQCAVRTAATSEELVGALARERVVVTHVGPSFVLGAQAARLKSVLWCAVFDADHSVLPDHRFGEAQLICWPTRYYRDWAIALQPHLAEDILARSVEVGYVRADGLGLSTREGLRTAWGLAPGRPVVLNVPDAYRLVPDSAHVTPWYRHVWCVPAPFERLARALLLRRSRQAVVEALTEGGGDVKVLDAVRRFCDRHCAQLVLAPRRQKHWRGKRGFTAAERRVADAVLPEGEAYPQTFPRAAQMADLVVCPYRSGAVLDALAAGVPYLTVGIPPEADSPGNRAYAERFDAEQGHRPGATWVVPAREFIASFARKSLDDFALDPAVLEAARAKYLGPVDGRCSQRVLQAIRTSLDARDRQSASAAVSPASVVP